MTNRKSTTVLAFDTTIVALMSAAPTLSHAGAANPCSYSANYGCGSVAAIQKAGCERTSTTAKANYADDTNNRTQLKQDEWRSGSVYKEKRAASGSVSITFTDAKGTLNCLMVNLLATPVALGCYHKV